MCFVFLSVLLECVTCPCYPGSVICYCSLSVLLVLVTCPSFLLCCWCALLVFVTICIDSVWCLSLLRSRVISVSYLSLLPARVTSMCYLSIFFALLLVCDSCSEHLSPATVTVLLARVSYPCYIWVLFMLPVRLPHTCYQRAFSHISK